MKISVRVNSCDTGLFGTGRVNIKTERRAIVELRVFYRKKTYKENFIFDCGTQLGYERGDHSGGNDAVLFF